MQYSSIPNDTDITERFAKADYQNARLAADPSLSRMRWLQEAIRAFNLGPAYQLLFSARSGRTSRAARQDNRVLLTDLLAAHPGKGSGKCVFGEDEDGRPVRLDIDDARLANILVSGMRGAGKTSLLRTIGTSLALENRQSELQLCVVDLDARNASPSKGRETLQALSRFPHLIFPVIHTIDGTLGVVDFLVDELKFRRERQIAQPLLIVILDGLDRLLVGKDRFLHRKFGLLLNGGPKVGFRFLLSLENPLAKEVRPLHRHQYGLRLAGKAIDENWAWAAAGMTGSGAHLLDGHGEFIAASGGESLRFQSAYIGKTEMNKMARQLHIQKGRSLLAQLAADDLPVFSTPARQSTSRKQHHVERTSSANGKAASEEGVDSGAGDWLTADWEDRFWMDRN